MAMLNREILLKEFNRYNADHSINKHLRFGQHIYNMYQYEIEYPGGMLSFHDADNAHCFNALLESLPID